MSAALPYQVSGYTVLRPQIEAQLKSGDVAMVLVGALHFAGPDGLLAQLKAKGYSITQLPFTETLLAIVAQPQPVTAIVGQAVQFSVTATGSEPVTYQWQRNTQNIPGATGASYTIASAQLANAGDYRVIVGNAPGNVTSQVATLIVNPLTVAPVIVAQPQPATGIVGQAVQFSVTATGSAPLTYQWQRNSQNIPSATSAIYAITSAQLGNAGDYRVIVGNAAGNTTSQVATLTVFEPVPDLRIAQLRLLPTAEIDVDVNVSSAGDYLLETSIDLKTWIPVRTFSANQLALTVRAPNPAASLRFFRVVPATDRTGTGTAGFVWIKPGTFVMGSPTSEAPLYASAEVQHTVTLTHGFWISDHETTQDEYQSLMGSNPSYFQGDGSRPVERLSWNEAVAYCQKLTLRERAAGQITPQQTYRLPTEAEWEYAARAGTTGARYGDMDAIGWFDGNSGSFSHPASTHSVKQKVPNAWGLYDMIGNVWEWCADWYGEYPTGIVTDPNSVSSGPGRVLRGGCWACPAGDVRFARRGYDAPVDAALYIGFRPVLSLN